MTITLNVDAGEGGLLDASLIALADSVNIACGGHAGDLDSMQRTITLAEGKHIGAHPSYEDRENFGRHPLTLPPEEISSTVARQVGTLAQLTPLQHVKPHGALYNQAQQDEAIAEAIITGISTILPSTKIFTLPGGALARAAAAAGHQVIGEGFIDRGYQANGQLIPRGQPGGLITDPIEALAQAKTLAARDDIDTLCIHSDSPKALELLKAIHQARHAL
ncbi:MAG: LamB/YcsF family protein [Akkermansiaceae bacterium]